MGRFYSFEEFLDLFPPKPRERIRDGYNVICPAHNDRKPSLSVTIKDGAIGVKCQAGCETEDVLKSKGLTFADLFLGDNNQSTIKAVYPYHDENRKLLYEVVRYEPRDFSCRRPDGKKEIKDVRRVIYHLPDITTAIASDDTIYITEGEKDAETIWDLGLVATTNPFGAGKWKPEYSEMLSGASVVIIPDNDPEGRKHAVSVINSLEGKVKSLKVLEVPDNAKDITEWIEQGHDLDDFMTLECNPPKVYKSSLLYCPNDSFTDTKPNKIITKNLTDTSLPLAKRIEDWVKQTTGWFDYHEIDREFNLASENDKQNRLMILRRLQEKGIIEKHKTNNNLTRYVNTDFRLIDFKSAGKRTPLAIKYPFQIEKKFNTYPGNLIVVAGAADSGKTAFLLNFIKLNMFDFSIYYQSSEMGEAELGNRLEQFDGIDLDKWNFVAEERSGNFADVIRPDCVNIIDYLEFNEGEFYLIADYLRAIHDKLSTGICLIALQKKRGASLGRGGDFGLEKPRLYLTMDAGKLKIQKAKNWVNPSENPNGLMLDFKIVQGCEFGLTRNWYSEDE
ncbi:hypothetical protein ACFLUH_03370 [Chloroflexota bacterium]